ncbi:MAG: hypothetical protein JW743_06390 [Deltaproteobacteria bacterium]|nr:hypothetical protein [Deltaproteobacteria bacterium]MBN2845302.1 hypothetical protein [Deltaproteobacteria bacterium]
MSKYKDDEFSVIATPTDGTPKSFTFPLSTESSVISGLVAPLVTKQDANILTSCFDLIKENYKYDKNNDKIVIKMTESEISKIGDFAFQGISADGEIKLDGGSVGASVQRVPTATERTKITKIEFSIEDK